MSTEASAAGNKFAEHFMKIAGRTLEDMESNYTESDEDGQSLRLYRWNGKTYPAFGDVAFKEIKGMEVRDDDVFLMGYPKTGCHWMYEVLHMLRKGQAKLTANTKSEAFLDVVHPNNIKALPSPRVLNSHLLFEDLPTQLVQKKTKIVLTVRNAKDTAASLYNHHKKIPLYTYDNTFNKWFPFYFEGRVDYGSYFDYYKSWDDAVKANPDHPILVVSYEDMKEDLPREAKRLAKFLGLEISDEFAVAVAEAAGLNNMKAVFNQKSGGPQHVLVRKGEVGDSKNWLTVAQSEALDALIKEKIPNLSIYQQRFTL